jgi:predicted nucleic acid-binding protein
MSFLLDTNAVSEWVKPRPYPGLIEWMESTDEDRIFISVVSLRSYAMAESAWRRENIRALRPR